MGLNEKALEKLSKIRERCTQCNGLGFSVSTQDGVRTFKDCECVEKIKTRLSYIEANIPLRYVNWDISELKADFIDNNKLSYNWLMNYLANLDAEIDKGSSFWLSSTPGLAKSSILSYVVRKSIDIGRVCYFERAANIHSLLFSALDNQDSRDLLNYIIEDVELLVLEEIDKVYLKDEMSFNNKAFFDFISAVYDSNKSIIVSSNDLKQFVIKKFPTFIADRFVHVTEVLFQGPSGRK